MRSLPLALLAAASLIPGCAPQPVNPDSGGPAPATEAAVPGARSEAALRVTAEVAEVTGLINDGDAKALFARFAPSMKEAVSEAALVELFESLLGAKGRLGSVTATRAVKHQGEFEVAAERGSWALSIALDDAGQIVRFKIVEPVEAPPELERSAPASLPFRGEWMVFWGGDTKALNYHVDYPSQRRSADLVIVDEAGKTHRGAGEALTDYYAYGQEILAMADGVVVGVVDGVADSVPGEKNPYLATGNMVLLRHDGEAHSVYAHLIPSSVKVKVGAKVRGGQVLGACGNSGNSSEPHLHVQFQDGPRIEKSWGIEAVFAEAMVSRDGARERRSDYIFRKGDRVAPVELAAE